MSAQAVVLGMGLNGLGVVRSLARADVDVIAVDDDVNRPGMQTRYGKKHQVRAMDGYRLVEDMVTLARNLDSRPVLFITQEATVKTVSAYRDELSKWYRMPLASAHCLVMLLDKNLFHQFAERHGFCIPKSLHVADHSTMKLARDFRFPVVLKPAARDENYSRSFKKAYRLEDYDALEKMCGQILPVLPDLIVQEWIDGEDADIYFCLQYVGADGEPVASFTGRKIRSWPPRTGGTASCVAAPEVDEILSAETTKFFKASGFTGMGSMEYKRDAKTGEFFMIEPTVGRTDFQEEVATLNGVNIPYAAWCSVLGMDNPPTTPVRRRVVWREASVDRWSAELQHQNAGSGPLDSDKVIDGWWRWYDPAPAGLLFRQRVIAAIKTRFQRPGKQRGEVL